MNDGTRKVRLATHWLNRSYQLTYGPGEAPKLRAAFVEAAAKLGREPVPSSLVKGMLSVRLSGTERDPRSMAQTVAKPGLMSQMAFVRIERGASSADRLGDRWTEAVPQAWTAELRRLVGAPHAMALERGSVDGDSLTVTVEFQGGLLSRAEVAEFATRHRFARKPGDDFWKRKSDDGWVSIIDDDSVFSVRRRGKARSIACSYLDTPRGARSPGAAADASPDDDGEELDDDELEELLGD